MRIISWNVNGIRAVEKKWEIQNIIQKYDPDILFLQEIKATPDKISDFLLAPLPYTAHYNPAEKPGYAGTWAWVHERISSRTSFTFMDSFPGDPTANEGRVAHIEIIEKSNGAIIDIFGIYFPNGGKSEQAWKDKLVFYTEFWKYMDQLRWLGHSVMWWGDLNCAHHPIDLARPKENDGKIGFHPLERAWLDNRTDENWHDIWRKKNPEMRDVYSWWDVITRSRDKNVGWRIDAWWGSDDIYHKTHDICYLWDQMGSDHCPIMIDLDI